ncbi:MAG: threonine--tRNA ligase [Candidatus Aenigmatarchaeota archaeon]
MAEAKKEFKILGTDGKVYDLDEYRYKKGEEDFRVMVEKEALGKENPGGGEPEYIKHCRRFGIDWEDMSDSGHMHYGPAGAFIFDLIAAYSKAVVEKLGIPVYEVKGTPLFRLGEKAIAEHAKLFGDRLYQFELEDREFVLRYAACFQQFSIMKNWIISYRNLPYGAFEVADSWRLEQSGELLLCFRTRRFYMPDCHVFCRDIEQAKEWTLKVHDRIYCENEKLGRNYVSLYNMTSKEFFEKERAFLMKMVEREKKPVLLCFYPPGKKYYWLLNVEYMIIDRMKRPREIGTVQIDVGNAERFGIMYTDADNSRKYPVILHTAMIGSIERYLFNLFDTALLRKNPMLPMWLSPAQVRLCPVNDSMISYCEEIAGKMHGVRVDIDDRNEKVQKKVRDAEQDWVPLIVVVGEKEKESGLLAVRFRESGAVESMRPEDVVKYVKEKTAGYPFRELPFPVLLTKRPIFHG